MLLAACNPAGSDSSAAQPVAETLTTTDYPIPPGALFVATNGNDYAPGDQARPLRSLGEAVRRAQPGATIVLREGTYRETVGIIDKKLSIQPFPHERVWLKGSRVVSQWVRDGKAWRHDGWDVPLCRTCFMPEIIDPAYPQAGLPDMAFVDGRPLRQVGDRRSVTVGTFYVDVGRKQLLIGEDPTGRLVEATEFDWLLQFDGAGAAGSSLRGIGIAHYGSIQKYGQRGAMVVVNAPAVTLEHNTFAASASTGAAIFQPDANVTHNRFLDNGLVGLVANRADGLKLSANTFARNNNEHFSLTGEAIGAAGAKVTRTKRAWVSDNTFADNIGTGWWCDLGCTDAVVVRNIARGNVVNGLYYEVSARALIASNIVVGNGGRGIKISSSDHVRLVHNTLIDNGLAIGLYNDKRSPHSDRYSEEQGLSWVTSNTELLNNFLIRQHDAEPFMEAEDHKPYPQPIAPFISASDGNAYLREAGSAPLGTWSLGAGNIVTIFTLPRLRERTGQDLHSLAGAPSPAPFRDPGRGDYSLRESATGFRAGRPLPRDVARIVGVNPNDHPNIGVLSGPRV
ncbi:right-handed parallel beta-helix repeat-containing protein [Saccharopolyspora phatthalungensis]|uniref:Parallel beta-helix repeat protein n=1 Tax=Saccharopolyspora phatthalungensis TaxID=664693 RepID=A0A840QIK2_9PSEU|nr:right-handed parallel beta-helix repeat-containing protein [Saccharopolyspora phatthalungensis]MBB5158569.1 parallel beta-helix repeat protein [Saccharopolyspora phatthalungensis]